MQTNNQSEDFLKELGSRLAQLPQEKRIEVIKEMTQHIASMDKDIRGMIGVFQTAKENKEIEGLKSKMK